MHASLKENTIWGGRLKQRQLMDEERVLISRQTKTSHEGKKGVANANENVYHYPKRKRKSTAAILSPANNASVLIIQLGAPYE